MNIFKKFNTNNFDWPLTTAIVLLICVGLMAIYSVDLSRGGALIYFKKQTIALAVGLVLYLLAATRRYTFFYSYSKLAYYIALAFLIAVLFLGSTIRGTTGWFNFGVFSLQPVEIAKVGLILILAYIVFNYGRRFEQFKFFFGTGFVTAVPVALVLLQPDLGSALLLIAIWFGIMLIVGARKLYIFLFIFLGIAVALSSWAFVLQDYQKERVLTFLDPARDPLNSGYNVSQALIAIGSGKFFGRGLGFGSQSQLRFLPEAQTDFVFSVIGEELGMVGTMSVVILFVLIFWRLYLIAKKTDNDYIATVVYGVIVLIFAQFTVNVGANLGIMPVTGVTLPFVSYGGSSLIANLFLLGIVQSMVEEKY